MDKTTINFRTTEELKNAFEIVAKSNDLTSSQMLRHFMKYKVEQYMAENKLQDINGIKK